MIAGAASAPKLVGALASGLAILRYLVTHPGPVGVTRVARDLSLNASTCFNLLRTLVHEGLVNFDDATKTYSIGLGVVELARGALNRASLVRLVQPQLDALAVRHSVTVVMWQAEGNDRMILVHAAEHPGAVRVQMTVGTRLPRFIGAAGRCMAAFSGLSKAQLKTRFAALRWDVQPSFDSYWQSIEAVRERGWAIDDGQYQRGATVLAVPVRDGEGHATMTLGCAAFSGHMDTARTRALVNDLSGLAARLSRALVGQSVPGAGTTR